MRLQLAHLPPVHACLLHTCLLHTCLLHAPASHTHLPTARLPPVHACLLHACLLHTCLLHTCLPHTCLLTLRLYEPGAPGPPTTPFTRSSILNTSEALCTPSGAWHCHLSPRGFPGHPSPPQKSPLLVHLPVLSLPIPDPHDATSQLLLPLVTESLPRALAGTIYLTWKSN